MTRGLLRLAAAVAAIAILSAVLAILIVNARQKGKLSHCRNNLRRLGGMVHSDRLNVAEDPPEERGRAFWQHYRRREYYNAAQKRWIRKSDLNPFACPVLGRCPSALSVLSEAEYSALMDDAGTIDYRGPKELPTPPSGRIVLAADRDGNHPSGGYVLLVDLTVAKGDDAVDVSGDWSQAVATTD
jgi:hypothetical protein